MHHTAHGYWLDEAGAVAAAPALSGEISADVVVIGGGYAGLWAARRLRERGATVAVVEAEGCGRGARGGKGGVFLPLGTPPPAAVEPLGPRRGRPPPCAP